MAHKLGLKNKVMELKLGKSFTHKGSNGFHTIRCKKRLSGSNSSISIRPVLQAGTANHAVESLSSEATNGRMYNTNQAFDHLMDLIDNEESGSDSSSGDDVDLESDIEAQDLIPALGSDDS
ncbi:hypothetical protein GQR58_024657 [Nymphon striatum]|nr:hypothetical protein GQR58_024657 [Nymphon striatum]